MKLKVFTAFSGYDSQCLALNEVCKAHPDFDYELVGWSEIDKYAIQAHNKLFPQWADRNYGDISKIDVTALPDFDLFTYSSPCQDISNAGHQKGLEEGSGTRSSLLWYCENIIKEKKPKYCMFENVKALVSNKFLPYFKVWLDKVSHYGYTNYAQVLNAKDYGVPQNRERIFVISIRNDTPTFYRFPSPEPLTRKLKDVLEHNVDESYYLSDESIMAINAYNERNRAKGNGFQFKVSDGGGYSSTIVTNAYRSESQLVKDESQEE